MKQDAAFFEGKQAVLIYIGKRLRDSLRLEAALAQAGVDFGVEADEYSGGLIFKSARTGAFFYVLPEAVEAAYAVMQQNGYKPYEGPQAGDVVGDAL